jgi:DNA repair exonuclease SbcCD nuclease subunit
MKFTLSDGRTGQAIGDPHFGRKFEVGVPLKKRGEREASQMRDFRKLLNEDVDVCIVVGDVFDYPFVPYSVVQGVAAALAEAAEHNPDRDFIVYAGNHDMPRDATKVGAFHDLVERLQGRYDNLTLARRPMVVNQIAIVPWEWDRRADEQVSDLAGQKAIAAFGHWDLVLFDGKDDHLAPTKALKKTFGDIPIYTGHIHKPGDYIVDGHTVACTGSLQPYSHGEDDSGTFYVTEALSDVLAKPEGYYKDKVLRVLLKPGESLPVIDAMAVTPKRVVEEKASKITVSLSDFDWKNILSKAIEGMDPEVKKFTLERMPYVGAQE